MTAEPAPAAVALSSLVLTDLRNYASLRLDVPPGLVALTGRNGAGKTNFLEAISLLSPGRGLRRARYDEITRHGAPAGWAVSAVVGRDGEETRLGTGLVAGAPGEEFLRKVRINGAAVPSAEALLDHIRILWITPAMDGLFSGPAGERRKFLDRLVLAIDPGHAARVRDLDRLLTQRNRLLEQSGSPAWLDALEASLAAAAVSVALARAQAVALISGRIAERAGGDDAFPAGRLALSGEFDAGVQGRPAAQSELAYRALLAGSRSADRAAGRTLAGPHRSDLDVAFAEKGMPAALSSTGEQKALLIGLMLAYAEIVADVSGMTPVLLLDEAAAHLDPERRGALFARLAALGCQAFLTGTDRALFKGLPEPAALFQVGGDRVEPWR